MMGLHTTIILSLLVALTQGVSIPPKGEASFENDTAVSASGPSHNDGSGSVILPSQGEASFENDTAVGAPGSNREKKLFPVVRIVTFNNDPCVASDGLWGTCFSQKECIQHSGVSSGTCAKGYGVCCVVRASCGGVITQNNTYWNSPGYPTGYSTAGTCIGEIHPPPGTCQILLTFVSFLLIGPVAGDCNNDTFVFVGGNTGQLIPVLCGQNGGQHYYVDVEDTNGPYKIITTTSAIGFSRNWNIKVTFIKHGDYLKAPFRCLQYFRSTSGALSSFNYGGAGNQMLNNLNYAVCFGCVPGFCDVGISFNHFDLGNINGICGGDYVGAGPTKFCGDFPTLVIQVNATGPLILWVGSDSNNDNFESGFSGNYMMMAC